jgi:hypothetical protein
MLFAHDTEVALRGAAALVNTAATLPGDTEDLATVADLDAFVQDWEWTGSHSHDDAELASVHALRPRPRRKHRWPPAWRWRRRWPWST